MYENYFLPLLSYIKTRVYKLDNLFPKYITYCIVTLLFTQNVATFILIIHKLSNFIDKNMPNIYLF